MKTSVYFQQLQSKIFNIKSNSKEKLTIKNKINPNNNPHSKKALINKNKSNKQLNKYKKNKVIFSIKVLLELIL